MNTQIFLLLDMTASMSINKEAAMEACNEFLDGLSQTDGRTTGYDSLFTLGVFNSNIGLERVVKGVPVQKAPRIDHEHYRPDGATPLYDAIGQSMDLLEQHTGPVIFIIQTDGEENSSRHVSREDVVKRIAEKTALGWQFVYLGCDIDAMQSGGDLGIPVGNTMSYSRMDSKKAFLSLADSTRGYLDKGSTSSEAFFADDPSRYNG